MKDQQTSELEFIALMAFLMSNVALTIDAILPALTDIGISIDHTDSTDLQLIITMIFLGLGIGQLIFGTLSDSFGRKPIVYIGVGIFILASMICVTASNLEQMLIGRVIQGVGLAAPRTVSISIIRDIYTGDHMARIMSFIIMIFIVVPMIAPILGQVILYNFNWQAIFFFQLFFIMITIFWFSTRQRETLPKERRIKFSKTLFIDGLREFFKFKNTIIYTLIAGMIEGSFILYLSASKHVFQDQYQLVEEFPYLFAALAFVLGLATFFNGSLVLKYGMKRLMTVAMYLFCFSSLIYILLFFGSENPAITVLLIFLMIQFFSIGFISGNVGALAMRPIGHIAGIGASIFSFSSTIISVSLAILMGRFITVTALPLFIGFFCCSLGSLILLNLLGEK